MRYVSIILLVLFAGETIGQTRFGASAALNIASQHWTGEQSSYHRLTPIAGFQVGVFGNLRVNNQMALHAELAYSLEGRNEQLTAFNAPRREVRINYLRIPILLQYYFAKNIYAEAGPNLGVFLSGKETWTNQTISLSRDVYKPVDFGLSIGTGYHLSTLPGITIGARFYFGLANIVRPNINTGSDAGFKNRSISLTVRCNLPYGKE